MTIALDEKRRRRTAFMHALYERTDGRDLKMIASHEIGADLQWSFDETNAVTDYLHNEGLLRFPLADRVVAMTHAGVIEVERSLNAPESPTEHFAPLSVLMINSQLQVATIGSSQHQTVTMSSQQVQIEEFVTELRRRLPSLGLADTDRAVAEADLAAVESQLTSPRPNDGILREGLRTLRALVEGIADNAAYDALVELAQRIQL
jgi:hypothetical protein